MARMVSVMTDMLRLHYAPDNASLIVRLALEELKAPYETVLVERALNAQRSAEYLAINPNGLIPALETPTGVMFETGAILLWLADTHAALAPAPGQPARGDLLKWLFWTSNTLHADLRMTFYPEKYIGPKTDAHVQLKKTLHQRLAAHLTILDNAIVSQPLLTGRDMPTLMDLYLPCLLRWIALYGDNADHRWFDLSRYPALFALCARAETRASTHAAQRAEGLGPTPFTAPILATPPEGSAT